MLLVGGVGKGWTFLASAEIYDPAEARFFATGEMAVARESHAAVVLADGRVLLAGGAAQAEVFDPVAERFTLIPGAADLAGQFSASAILSDGRVLITGGYGEQRGPQAGAWLFQP